MNEGDQAPDFELPDENGTPVRLTDRLKEGPVVLFFYPGAMTGGCTTEACHFRDLATQFRQAGAQRLGISMDPVSKQKQFADMHGFDYPLLSDESGEVATSFGVRRKYITPVKRATFVIDTDQAIRAVITSERRMEVHADQALAAIEGLKRG
ncbi:MAG: peroxiredoxin [Nocardioidaceae bacterium]|nr:peroxiredoxin [Nocardioidaceae bacterium]